MDQHALYLARSNERQNEEIGNIVKSVAVGIAGLVTASFALQYPNLSWLWVVLRACSLTMALVSSDRSLGSCSRRCARRGGSLDRL